MAPRDPQQGWVLGGGKFVPGDERPELVLTERKTQDCVHSRHARLSHNYSSGALVLHLSDQSLAVVDGKDVGDSVVIWSIETSISFGTMSYRLQLDDAYNGIHRNRLKQYKQTYGLGMNSYPITLLSTPAESDYIKKTMSSKTLLAMGASQRCSRLFI